MFKKTVSGIFSALLLLNVLTLAFYIQPVEASGTIYIRSDGSVEPLDAPISTLDYVTYMLTDDINGSVVVERSNIIIDGNGYTVQGTGSGIGFNLTSTSNVTIKNTNIKGYYYGILLSHSSNYNSIFGNNVTNNDVGIDVYMCSENTLSGNNVTNNMQGIKFRTSSNNFLRDNAMADNSYNFRVGGMGFSYYVHDVDTSNTVDGKPFYYWVNKHDATVPSEAGCVTLVNCTNMKVENLTLTKDGQGILFAYTSNSTIYGNNITSNDRGVELYYSSNNTIYGNTITANNGAGVYLDWSSNNNTLLGNNVTANNMAGVYLHVVSNNNTLSGNTITNNDIGIHVYMCSENTLSGNNVTDNDLGIQLEGESSGNTLCGNNLANNRAGVQFWSANNNTLCGNKIVNNQQHGIYLIRSSNNSVSGNNIANNELGIGVNDASSNRFYHNSFIDNTRLIHDASYIYPSVPPSVNVWDNGYPSGGNYWSDYNGTDIYSGPYQSKTGFDGIGDTPYVIDENNTDHYPLMNPWTPPDIAVINVVPSKTVVEPGSSLCINVTIQNQGNKIELFNVTVYANTITIATFENITLTSGTSTTITFTWNTTSFAKSDYTISAYAWPVPGETDTDDNLYIDGTVQITGWTTCFIGLGGYPIIDFAVFDGKLYAAADSTLYALDGTSWDVVAAPTYVTSVESYKDKLVVGGQDGLYYYDGTSFSLIFSVPTYIKVLGVYNTTLYAGTFLDKPPTLYYCNGSAENPSNWYMDTGFSSILNFSGPFGSIDSFAVFNNQMYVSSGATVYSYNGTDWSIVKTYEDVNTFLDMKVYNGKLYLATRDQAWRKPYYQGYSGFSGRVIEFDGNNWTTAFDHDYWIYSLETYDTKLYAGTANKIYTYNGTDWSISFESTEGAYYAISLKTYDGKIYAGMGNGYIFVDLYPEITQSETVTVPEFPSFIFLPLFMLTMLVAVLIKRRRRVP